MLINYRWRIGCSKLNQLGTTTILPKDISISQGPRGGIFIGEYVSLGKNTIFHAINANITIKDYVLAADGLQISTGDHERRIGRYCQTITENDKNHEIELDKDVVIMEDVWIGYNVIILKGVTIGRGCTIAAGSVITKSTPPYSVVGGVPGRFIKFYWTIDQILEHEKKLYREESRLTHCQLIDYFNKYRKN